MTLIAAPVEAADISDGGLGPLGLHLQSRDQSVFGPDHEPIAFTFNTDADSELRLHADAPFAEHAQTGTQA
jgi:hypothetical protein